MIDFLIKSTASLFLLLACYHLLLEKEKMHQFNRFYLLFSLVFSFCIPFFTIEIIREVVIEKQPNVAIPFMEASTSITPESTNYLLLLAYVLYSLVTLVLLTRFALNVIKLHKKSKSHTNVIYKEATLILLPEKTLPYTFLNTIFVNEEDYSNRKIEDELYTHELIHVTQKHTLDVLLIELIKVIMWFNPVLHFYKKAIQLNHEFLADEKVATTHKNVPFYQNLLLAKANANPTYYLASNLNYSVTKKRLIMMTKNTSTTRSLVKKGLIIPVLTIIMFVFCTNIVAQVNAPHTTTKNIKNKKKSFNSDRDHYYAGVRIIIKSSKNSVLVDKIYEELSLEEKNRYLPYVPKKNEQKSPTAAEYEEFKNNAKYAIWIDNINIPNSKLNEYKPTNFVYFTGSSVLKNAKSKRFPQPFQYSLYTRDYFNKHLKNAHQKYSGKKITIYKS